MKNFISNKNLQLNEDAAAISKAVDDFVDSWSAKLKKELISGTPDVEKGVWEKFKTFIATGGPTKPDTTPKSTWTGKGPSYTTFQKPKDTRSSWTGTGPSYTYEKRFDVKKLWGENISLQDYKMLQETFNVFKEDAELSSIKMFQIIDKHALELKQKLKEILNKAKPEPKSISVTKDIKKTGYKNLPAASKEFYKNLEKFKSTKTDTKKEKEEAVPVDASEKPSVGSATTFRKPERTASSSAEEEPTKATAEPTKATAEPTKATAEPTKATAEPAASSTETVPAISQRITSKIDEEYPKLENKYIKMLIHLLENHDKLSNEMKVALKNFDEESSKKNFLTKVDEILRDEINEFPAELKKHYLKNIEEVDNLKKLARVADSIFKKYELS